MITFELGCWGLWFIILVFPGNKLVSDQFVVFICPQDVILKMCSEELLSMLDMPQLSQVSQSKQPANYTQMLPICHDFKHENS